MNRKIILNLAISLDGYIADKNKGLNWLRGDGSDPNITMSDMGFDKFLSKIDSIIMGRNAYEVTKSFAPLGKQFPNKTIYVMTSHELNDPDVIKIEGTPKDVLKQTHGNVWMFGGGLLANSFLREDLITDLEIAFVPTMIGNGIKMFHKLDSEIRWKLISTRNHNGMVFINYERQGKNESK